MIETIAMAAAGLALVFFLLVVLFMVAWAIFRAFRRPPPPPAATIQPPPNYFEAFRPPPPPSFLEGFSTYVNGRKAEIETQKLRDTLDSIAGVVGPGPVPPPSAPPNG